MSVIKKFGKKEHEKARIDERDAETAATVDKKWLRAAEKYMSAADNYEKGGLQEERDTCTCKARACELNYVIESKDQRFPLPAKLREAAQHFKALGEKKVELVLSTKVKRSYSAANLVAEFEGLSSFLLAGATDQDAVAKRCFDDAARKLQSLGEAETFAIAQLSDVLGRQATPIQLAFEANARSHLMAANVVFDNNPEEGIGVLAKAVTSFEQAGMRDSADGVRKRQKKFQAIRTCYFCGRESQGEDVHFRYYRSTAGNYFKGLIEKKGQDPNMIAEDGDAVVLCRVCGSAVHFEAEDVAKMYYDKMLVYVRSVAEQLLSRIMALEQIVSSLRLRIR